MNNARNGYLLTISALLIFLLGATTAWVGRDWLDAGGPDAAAIHWIAPVVLLIALALLVWALSRFVHAYFRQIKELNEEARLALHANAEHRIEIDGTPAVVLLAATLNEFTTRHAAILADRDDQIAQAQAEIEEERNMLAALMSELISGVLVCALDGRILLYNRSARRLLNPDGGRRGGFVGLGRSVFGLIDRNALNHALIQLYDRNEHPDFDGQAVCSFVTTTSAGALMRARTAPFLNQAGEMAGFVLVLQDMTQGIETSSRRDFLLQNFTEQVRHALGTMRVAIETITAYPEMEEERRVRFQQIVEEEAQGLSTLLDETIREYARDLKAQWRLEEVTDRDLLRAVRNRIVDETGLDVAIHTPDTTVRLLVDSYTLVHGLTTVARQLAEQHEVPAIKLCVLDPFDTATAEAGKNGRHWPNGFGAVDLRWKSPIPARHQWQQVARHAFVIDEGDATLSLKEVAESHGGEVWFQMERDDAAYFRLLLPLAAPSVPANDTGRAPADERDAGREPRVEQIAPALESRPEYYDFNLFRRTEESEQMENRRLTEVAYTVFDTETTGLDPERDEIIAIGAVRLLNGRVLRQEIFDRLVDPGRPVPHESTAVHGISTAMVKGEPRLDVVLPSFARFAEETVLVAHNAAFDMKMFQVKEATTAVRFTPPVLDTLLLSAVVHPSQSDHSLEAIAHRLGISAFGRHTALGDALVTADVFLRLIPLLAEQGIDTLGQAQAATRETYFARIQY